MKVKSLLDGGLWSRATKLLAASAVTLGATQAVGCLNRPVEPVEPRTTSTVVEKLTQSAVDKVDLLLMLDNSRSMADKQQILKAAVPNLVSGLVNPNCLDDNGIPQPTAPKGPLEDCQNGFKREFPPVKDFHIGVVSSSLGGHGSDSCNPAKQGPSNDDHGELVDRQNAMAGSGKVATYQDKGFLAWDPAQKLMPPGTSSLDELSKSVQDLVVGVDQVGCGYEAQLEGWYRFLVDPDPYDTISVSGGYATPAGIDTKLLAQRVDFMRPSSLLAIIMLTDENDCSTKEYGQFWYAGQLQDPNNPGKNFHLPGSRAICKTNPDDKCCKSCGQGDGDCGPDPTCQNPLPAIDDDLNLRCFHQRERFGIDFLYPIDRYTQGLTSVTVPNRKGEMVPNPIYSDLNPMDNDSSIRDAGLVFLAGIVGVPWQDIARDPNDLKKGFKNSDELLKKDGMGVSTWDIILGDISNSDYAKRQPLDPLMIESVEPRSGNSPIVNQPLAAAGQGTPSTNKVNGKEYDIPKKDDLQYACVFDLPTSRDCTQKNTGCDCSPPAMGDPPTDSPLCMGTTQTKAKGYPGLRELAALKSVGAQGVVASICPAQVSTPGAADFGYDPAVGAIIDRLKVALAGKCLPRSLSPDKTTKQVPCLIIEARNTQGKCDNSCKDHKARLPISAAHKAAAKAAAASAPEAHWDCFCEIAQAANESATKDDLNACQNNKDPVMDSGGAQVDGWCYIDATTVPATGNASLVQECPVTERRKIRFVNDGNPDPGATLFITCSGE
jgi:hypothetical protein